MTTANLRPMAATAILLTATAISIGGCKGEAAQEEAREVPRNVRVLTLETSDLTEYFEIAGPVVPVRAADLAAQESGPVVTVAAAKGETVKEGRTIVEQERQILAAELAAAKSGLANQEYNVDKVRRLYEAGKVSRIELLQAEQAYALARSAVDVGQVRFERTAISAPFDGMVTERWVDPGELLNPGQRVARVIDPFTLKIEAFLTEGQVRWVAAGDAADVMVGNDETAARGRVSFVSPEADLATGKFAVEIEIPNQDLSRRSGVIGRARLPKHRSEGVVAVPRDAVLPGRAGPTAYVVAGDRAQLRQLRLGPYQGLMVVVEDGLEAGDEIVVRGHRDLRDGSLVRVTERADSPDGSLSGDPVEATATGAATRVDEAPKALSTEEAR